METRKLLCCAGSLLLASVASAYVYDIGSFDSGTDGWALSGFSSQAGRSPTASGGTLNFTPDNDAGFQWAIQNSLRDTLGADLDVIGAATSVLLSFDVTFVTAEWQLGSVAGADAWVQLAEVVYNSPSTGFATLTRGNAASGGLLTDSANPGFPGGWSANPEWYPAGYTTTLTWDITNLISGAVASDGYTQLAIAINYNSNIDQVGTFYFDNITLTAVPEPSTYAAMAGIAVLGLAVARRRLRK